MRLLYLPLAIIFLNGCATAVKELPVYATYDREEIAWSLQEGTGTVEGNAFLSRRDGQLVKCSGREAGLMAVGAYSIERFTKLYGSPSGGFNTASFGRTRLEAQSSDYKKYTADGRYTVCNVDGRFSFDNVPAGEYYVYAIVVWQVSDFFLEGGNLAKRIKVGQNETTKVTLSR